MNGRQQTLHETDDRKERGRTGLAAIPSFSVSTSYLCKEALDR